MTYPTGKSPLWLDRVEIHLLKTHLQIAITSLAKRVNEAFHAGEDIELLEGDLETLKLIYEKLESFPK